MRINTALSQSRISLSPIKTIKSLTTPLRTSFSRGSSPKHEDLKRIEYKCVMLKTIDKKVKSISSKKELEEAIFMMVKNFPYIERNLLSSISNAAIVKSGIPFMDDQRLYEEHIKIVKNMAGKIFQDTKSECIAKGFI